MSDQMVEDMELKMRNLLRRSCPLRLHSRTDREQRRSTLGKVTSYSIFQGPGERCS